MCDLRLFVVPSVRPFDEHLPLRLWSAPSIPVQWNLVCGRSYLARLPQSALFLGTLVSNFVAGPFGDKYGRQALLILSIFLQSVFGILSSFSFNVYVYIGLRFLLGVVGQGAILGIVVWIFELCDPVHRCAVQSYGNLLFILGGLSMPAISILMPNWRTLLLVTSVVSILPVFYLRCVLSHMYLAICYTLL